ncbi:MAG: ribonucleoside-diphosphate reductase subunit alpha [Clostridia bacterium]|nr:ribonucleoside-diphosphate reductase subunit alpha [Clostridia bacterium]
MEIIKRNGNIESFQYQKIKKAIMAAFRSVNREIDESELNRIVSDINIKAEKVYQLDKKISVEEVQDIVEESLVELNYYKVVKSYILYREQHNKNREIISRFLLSLHDTNLINVLKKIQSLFDQNVYSLEILYRKFESFVTPGIDEIQQLDMLIKAANELTAIEAPKWEYIASMILMEKISKNINNEMTKIKVKTFHEKLKYFDENNLYGKYMLEYYSEEEVAELDKYMDDSRNDLLTYSSLDLLHKRYLIKNNDNVVLEKPQEMFMGIAMHLAIPEGTDKVLWAKKIYDMTSKLKVTLATPTMSNARKPYHQLSSCFIDTVPDSLDGIYRSIENFAKVSKHGGGMGLYFGKVRAIGSDIRNFKGVAGGVLRWIKLANDTAVAVDQLGVRQGSVAVYLDIWHKDIPEFLQMKTNNGDDRMKAHDIFPGICYPDLFWRLARNNIESTWYMMCPHEILKAKGYALEDYFGDQWEEKYFECVNDPSISKREISVKDLIRLIIKSLTETGTPFTFNRDAVNKMNPNGHKGMIYSSNLCTEIAQNMSEIETVSTEITDESENIIVVTKTKPGDFVVCNLASLVLGNLNVDDDNEMEETIGTVVRAIDNVIDLNYYPVPYAKITNRQYRAIGLGTSGYHHLLAKKGIRFESEQHLLFADKLYEKINYYAVKASHRLAVEKGKYQYFDGSDWDTGEYFEKRHYHDEKWNELRNLIKKEGIRNGYLMAVAPTGSTSIIAGTTASIDPIMSKYFLEEKKGSITPRVAPDLCLANFWIYKSAHEIDQEWVIKAAAIRQKHIDQSQSVNLFITHDYTMRQIMNLYILAGETGVKSIYYVRSKSLEVEECESCSS